MKTMKRFPIFKSFLLALLTLLICICAWANAEQALSFPNMTQSECIWDGNGNLASETVYDLNGNPAINSRGFHRAVYTWDEFGNKLTEVYYGLQGETVINQDLGYARSVCIYETNPANGEVHLVSEDRYDENGNRADIPGSYSYRRDAWENGNVLVSSEYFNAAGELTRPTGGYAQILYQTDWEEDQIVTTKRYLDADGTPLIGSEGGEVVIFVYTTKEYLTKGIRIEYNALDIITSPRKNADVRLHE